MFLIADTPANRTHVYPRLYVIGAAGVFVALAMILAPWSSTTLPFMWWNHFFLPVLILALSGGLGYLGYRYKMHIIPSKKVTWAGSTVPVVQTFDDSGVPKYGGEGVLGRVEDLIDTDPFILLNPAFDEDGEPTAFTLRSTTPGQLADATFMERFINKLLKSMPGGARIWSAESDATTDELKVKKKKPFPPVLFPPIKPEEIAKTPTQAVDMWLKDSTLVFGKDAYDNYIRIDLTKSPHGMVIGGTGSGKSVFTRTTIEDLRRRGVMFAILDGKKVDYTTCIGLPNVVMVAQDEDDWMRIIKFVEDHMESRYAESRERAKKGLLPAFNHPPMLFLIDEFGSVVRAIKSRYGKAGTDDMYNRLKNIAAKGRQCRVHMMIATQEIYAETIPGDMQDNLSYVVSLGVTAPNTLRNAFSNETRRDATRIGQAISDKDKGRGIVEIKTEEGSSVVEFQTFYGYSPADNDPPTWEPAASEWKSFKEAISDHIPKMYPRMFYEKSTPDMMAEIPNVVKKEKDMSSLYALPVLTLETQDKETKQFEFKEDLRSLDQLDDDYVSNQGSEDLAALIPFVD